MDWTLVGQYLHMNYLQEYLMNQTYNRVKEKLFPRKICIESNFEPYTFAKHTIFTTSNKVILTVPAYVNLILTFLTEIVSLLFPLQLLNQIQLIFTMPLINANQISMITIDNLITTAIKDICNKKQRGNSITKNAFLTRPGMILYNLK